MELERDMRVTKQEWLVIEAIADGRTIKEVAQKLNKSGHTVNNQIQSVYEKLNLPHNLNALTLWYVCKKFKIALPEFMKNLGVTLMLFLMSFTIYQNYDDELRKPSRTRTRVETRARGRKKE